MKVYIVMREETVGPHRHCERGELEKYIDTVFAKEEDAKAYVKENSKGPIYTRYYYSYEEAEVK